MNQHLLPKLVAITLVAATLAAPPLWAKSGAPREPVGGSKEPRVIVLDFKTANLSWEGCTSSPRTPLEADQPVAFKIVQINPFRHAVTAKINQVNFENLFKTPALISSQLQPKPESADMKDKKAQGEEGNLTSPEKAKAKPDLEKDLWQKLTSFSRAADELVRFDNFTTEVRMWALLEDDPANLQNTVKGSACRLKGSRPPCDPAPEGDELIRAYDWTAAEVERQFNAMLEARANLQGNLQGQKLSKEVEEVFEAEKQRYNALTDTKMQRHQQYNKVVGLYTKILEPGFGTLLFGPVAATGDQVEIVVDTSLSADAAEIKLTSSACGQGGGEVEKKSAASSTDPLLVIPVLGRHRPSFSTGAFFTGLVSPTFFKDKENKAQVNETDRFTTALGAMVHTPVFFWFRYPDYSVHLSLGVALKDNNPIYVLGPSLIIGRRQRTVLTVGLAGGQVNRLSGIKLNDPVTGEQPATVKVFRTNFFFALTYNFDSTSAASTDTKNR